MTDADIAEQVSIGASSVRDHIEEIVKAGWAPIGNADGYYWVTDEDELERERETHLDTIHSKQDRVEGLEAAYSRGGPPTGHAVTDGGQAVADVPDDLATAVDAMVEAYGINGAEQELQRRFEDRDQQERVTAALGYLRKSYEVNT